jgi:hypothetical protein
MPLLFDLVFSRMEEHAEKLLVTARPAHIFRGTASRAVDAARTFWRGRECKQFFERYPMRPVVTEIVDLVKTRIFPAVECEITDAHIRRLERPRFIVVQALAFEEF